MPSEKEMRQHRCCFSGHRQEKLSKSPEEVQEWLSEQIAIAISDGYSTFITGMAMGVDIWAGEIVIRMRETNPDLHLIAIVPWPGFSARWNPEWRSRYETLLKSADLVRYTSQNYSPDIFEKRNKWMVDHSTRLIAFYNGEDGGTKDMISYAEDCGVDVVKGLDEPKPRKKSKTEKPEKPEKPVRPYPLNLIDSIMNCETFKESRPVTAEDIPAEFDERLRKAVSTIKDDRAYDYLMARFKDGSTLQVIAERENLSRERVRQLLEKYIRKLRHPDILRYLDCGIENIPERTSKAMQERLL